MDSTKKLRSPIVIYLDRPGGFFIISSVTDASDFLFDNWPDNDSQQWQDAMNQCASAEAGATSIDDARLVFIAAIRAAGIKIDPAIALY